MNILSTLLYRLHVDATPLTELDVDYTCKVVYMKRIF